MKCSIARRDGRGGGQGPGGRAPAPARAARLAPPAAGWFRSGTADGRGVTGRRRTGTDRSRERASFGNPLTSAVPPPAAPPSRHVPAAVRGEVYRRDEARCAFVGATGRRCGSRWQLELHHVVPFARGGKATADNLSVRCRRPNAHEARIDFG